MSSMLRSVTYAAAFMLPPILLGAVRGRQFVSQYDRLPIDPPLTGVLVPPPPAHDPSRPTVAVLLGADVTEITDALGPYEIFARTGRYNVYMVAPERRPSLLTGGLRILPHLSLAQLDERLDGKPAAVVVVPNIPNIKRAENQPLLGWMRRQATAGALMHSWCKGALALAESGLLDGRRATTHWGDIRELERAYPRVTWVRGVRWVEDQGLVASAGINSGIDASLRVLVRRDGDSVARRVAGELRYPNYHYAQNPEATQLELRPADAVLLANAAFRAARQRIGVALHDGVGELAISNVYDAYAASGVADVYAVASAPGIVRTRFGVTLLPSLVPSTAPESVRRLDRLVVVEGDVAPARAVAESAAAVAPELHAASLDTDPSRYPLETVLEDLARSTDLPSARFAAKRLEYRSASVTLRGSAIPWGILPLPLALGAMGALLVWLLQRSGRRSALAGLAIASLATPGIVRAQPTDSLQAGMRVRIGLHTGERTILRRPKTQTLIGTLVGANGDTMLLAVSPGVDPLRVPRAAINDLYVTRGVPSRLESAVRRALLPTLASAAFTAMSLNVRRRSSDPSPGRGALAAAGSTAALTGVLGLLQPRERWTRLRSR